MASITVEERASRIARALGELQDQARTFTGQTAKGEAGGYQTERLAAAAARFIEAVRLASRARGDRR